MFKAHFIWRVIRMFRASISTLSCTSTLIVIAPSTLISVLLLALILFLPALSIGLVTLLVLFGERRELRVTAAGRARQLRMPGSHGVKDVVSALQYGLKVGGHIHPSDGLLYWFGQHSPP